MKPHDYDLHINFPGGVPIDGPSAGHRVGDGHRLRHAGIPVDNTLAMTGEVSIHGKVKPVGGVVAKVEAAHPGRGADGASSRRRTGRRSSPGSRI